MTTAVVVPALLGLAIFGLAVTAGKFFASDSTIKHFREREQKRAAASNHIDSLVSGRVDRIHYSAFDRPGLLREIYWAGYRGTEATRMVRSMIKLCIGVTIGAVTGTLIFGLSKTWVFLSLFSGLLLYTMFRYFIRMGKKRRQSAIERELPQFLDLLVTTVESGMGFMASIRALLEHAADSSPLWAEWRVMEREYAGGLALTDACTRLAKRCGVDNLTATVGGLIQTEQIGASLGRTLRVLAVESRSKRRAAMREKASRLPVELILPSGLVFLSMMILTLGPSLMRVYDALESF